MKKLIFIMSALCISSAASAQETSVKQDTTATQEISAQKSVIAPSENYTPDAWKSATKSVAPKSWKPQTEERSVVVKENPDVIRSREHELNRETRQMKVTIGNTAANNWSSFPDRMLDARTLSAPLPRK